MVLLSGMLNGTLKTFHSFGDCLIWNQAILGEPDQLDLE